MPTRTVAILVGVLASVDLACASSGVRTIDPVPGYGLAVVNVTPKPGALLSAGHQVTFSVTVKYHLELTDSGTIVLIPQNERGTSLVVGRGQVTQVVRKGTGQVTLSDSLVIPTGMRDLQLFVLLVPAGYTRASGQLVMQFPIR